MKFSNRISYGVALSSGAAVASAKNGHIQLQLLKSLKPLG